MVQAYAEEVLNRKDEESADSGLVYRSNALYEATERLLSALDRLEYGMEAQGSGGEDAEMAAQLQATWHENASLREEREKLNTVIENLKTQYGDLHRTASGIYNKLDDTIRRLTQLMKD